MLVTGGALAGTGSGLAVQSVEGQLLTGPVATYASSVSANQRFVQQATLDTLGRSADAANLAFGDVYLGGGGSRTDYARALIMSVEGRTRFAVAAYEHYLQRDPVAVDLNFWVPRLVAGTVTDEQFRAALLGSDEYRAAHGGTTPSFVITLWQEVLGHAPDAPTLNFFTMALENGSLTRTDLAYSLLATPSGYAQTVESLFQTFLHRAADAAAASFFGNQLLIGAATDEDVAEALVGSPEYFAHVPSSFATATVDWGDGTSTPASIAGGVVTGAHRYLEEGTWPLTVAVTDLDGTTRIVTTATVTDAPLAAAGTVLTVDKKTAVAEIVATFTDADPNGVASDYTVTIDWGDGAASSGAVSTARDAFDVTGTHTYKKKGTYTAVVRVSDVGGASARATTTVEVVQLKKA